MKVDLDNTYNMLIMMMIIMMMIMVIMIIMMIMMFIAVSQSIFELGSPDFACKKI